MVKQKDVFEDFGESLSFADIRVSNIPKPDIFLCGGPQGKSVRHFFFEHVKRTDPDFSKRFVFVENMVKGWFSPSTLYGDLLSLESDIANLVTAIVIFVESPGSIAELGAFSCIEGISDKLIVVMRSDHHSNESFIMLGPVRRISSIKNYDVVFPYPWEKEKESKQYLSDIVADIKRSVDKIKLSTTIDYALRKKICLLLELVQMFGMSRKSEILKVLERIDPSYNSDKCFERFLMLLEKIGYIGSVVMGAAKNKYYFSKISKSCLSFGFNAEAKNKDRVRWKLAIREHIKSIDSNRSKSMAKFAR